MVLKMLELAINGQDGTVFPFPITAKDLERGRQRYTIYCTPCHSRVGNGEGLIVLRGYRPAGNFHTARLQTAPLGHFFHVITNGYGAMPDYSAQVAPADRWAIVAYIRALQLSQHATQADVAAGAHVEALKSIASNQGMPESFADDQKMPATAVTGTTDGGLLILPAPGSGVQSNTPAASKPAAKPATGAATPQQ